MSKLRHISELLPPDLKALIIDETLNDSDKTFTIGAGVAWLLNALRVNLAATATVGNRQIQVYITNASDVIHYVNKVGAVQAASATYDYYFAPGNPRETSVVANTLLTPLPDNLWVPAGWKVRVLDSAAVDAAADDMKVYALGQEVPTG